MKTTKKQLEFLGKRLVILGVFLLSCYQSYAQCNQVQTITLCDITTIDFDNNLEPDGIINLYNETGTTLADGTWSTSLNNSIVLDQATGNLAVWELRDSSTDTTGYTFELSNNTCGSDPAMTVTLIVGPYSGIALPPDDDDINYYICSGDLFPLNLSTVLVSNSKIPVAHINGTWELATGVPTLQMSFLLSQNLFNADVAYQPGLPRVDQDVYELVYTVPGLMPCSPDSKTFVKISVVRQVFAGEPAAIEICENEILAGDYDADINVKDDPYLVGEDIEGYWNDELNGVGNNLNINIKDLYTTLIDNGNNQRFGCKTYEYTYTVEKRSVVCQDDASTVSFKIFEALRQFQQVDFPELCPGKVENPPVIVKLYDLLGFENGFIYEGKKYTHWEFISGPSNLGLVSKRSNNLAITDLRCIEDPAPDEGLAPPYYDPEGSVNITGARPGDYRFRFYVCSDIVGCEENICPDLETEVVLRIFAEDHAGENTTVNVCESVGTVDLRSLMNTNGLDAIATTGTWTNGAGDIVDNTFNFPDVTYPQSFDFTYATLNANGCADSADLTLNISKLTDAGEDGSATICSDNLTITLFDVLGGNPDTTGSWVGPFGYNSEGDHLGVFDVADTMLPILGEGVYTYTVPGNVGCGDDDTATVTISIVNPVEIGKDRSETFCKLDGRVNLYSLLDRDTPRTGVFEDTENTLALGVDGVLEFETLTNDIYDFRYVISNALPCDESSLIVSVQIVDLPVPNVPEQEFCILDAKHLEDIEVDVLNYNWYDKFESETPIIDNPLLFDDQVYYIASVDADNCESERLEVKITILNTGEKFKNGDLCTLDFQDGVSPNGDAQNDTFDLLIDEVYNIPEAFPDFDLKIYNRYGSLVYEGNINTEEFRGSGNVSSSLGDDLSSGTYFYIFTPNFENNLPIQGSFYLSR